MATTRNKEFANKMRLLRSHGIEKNQNRFIGKGKEAWKYEQQFLGMNYRMTDIQAALGISQVKRLEKIIEERTKIKEMYRQGLQNCQIPIKLLNIPENVSSALHLCIIQLIDQGEEVHEQLFMYLRKNNIGVQVHYSPIHLQPYYKKLGFKEGDFPNSELYEKNCLSIPIFPGLLTSEQSKVLSCWMHS